MLVYIMYWILDISTCDDDSLFEFLKCEFNLAVNVYALKTSVLLSWLKPRRRQNDEYFKTVYIIRVSFYLCKKWYEQIPKSRRPSK